MDRNLEVPHCALTGVASLSQKEIVVIEMLPVGFKAVSSQYGDTFYCEGCNRAAGTA
jgi:hypothetical protein